MKLYSSVFATVKPNDKSDEEWEFEHKQVCGFIRQSIEDNVQPHLYSNHARTLWKKLKEL